MWWLAAASYDKNMWPHETCPQRLEDVHVCPHKQPPPGAAAHDYSCCRNAVRNNELFLVCQCINLSRSTVLVHKQRWVICDVIHDCVRSHSYRCETAAFLLIQSNAISVSNINILLFLIALVLSLPLTHTHSFAHSHDPLLPLLTSLAYRELAKLSELSIC